MKRRQFLQSSLLFALPFILAGDSRQLPFSLEPPKPKEALHPSTKLLIDFFGDLISELERITSYAFGSGND